jgi:non-homologous end joining protein Ku
VTIHLFCDGVHVHNAVESKSEISFRQIHKPTGRRVNYQKTVSGVGVVENADIVNVVDLMEALKRSIGENSGPGKRKATRSGKSA